MYKSIELFAGAGGLALGMELAGFNHLFLVDNDYNCIKTLHANRNWKLIKSNVDDVNYNGIDADVITGGFPCQSFSHAGYRLGFNDIRGTAFFGFAKAIKEIKPPIFLAENVKGLITHDKGNTLAIILSTLRNLGYNVKYKILNTVNYNVPQRRERIIIVGVRVDIVDIHYEFPLPSKHIITLREALKNVPKSEGAKYSESRKKVLYLVPEGGNWRHLSDKVAQEYMLSTYYTNGGRTGIAKRLAWNEPSLTLMCSPIQKQTERCHPSETRPLTIREYARIQTFPDSWVFKGSISNQYKQIGNAVPVKFAEKLGQSIVTFLDKLRIS